MRPLFLGACLFAMSGMAACAAPVQNSAPGSVQETAENEEKMDCRYESVTGSHMQYKVCRTRRQQKESHEDAERLLRSAPLPDTRPPPQ